MKKCNMNRKGSNKGFSLIEVLLAVVLLGLIAAPILQMFYSSYAMNLRSRKYLAASDLLQSAMEGISTQTWESSYTIGNNTEVKGLKNYYENVPIVQPSSPGKKAIYSFNDTQPADAPKGFLRAKTTSGNPYTLFFEEVEYDSYTFHVYVECSAPSVTGSYYSVPIKVSVYDSEDAKSTTFDDLSNFKLIQSATTQIPNKR